ncbi:hypothetical protein EJ04DRAFT_530010 [Polyplosphaeria fusca]|uniref:Uncharacterized protein n=1 Tax=Polyplosphaeria fusca TaxID=682080 RepID=A0A9P4QJ93_9PLEO|nr:hypothetical protein EJ04DRAFT_530010 [Polyplosphaeria fusca]
MLFVLVAERADFIVTLGDCAVSFLHFPYSTTTGMCVFSRDSVISAVRKRTSVAPALGESEKEEPGVWRKQQHPHIPPVSRSRSFGEYFLIAVTCTSFLLCTLAIATLSILRGWGTTSDLILGRFNITSQNTLLVAFLVNTPQLILSFCYLSINSICTSMAGAREWNQMGVARKGLRVT